VSLPEETALDLLAEAFPLLNPRLDRDPDAADALFGKVRAFLRKEGRLPPPSRILVTKASHRGRWYADSVGQEFDVCVKHSRPGFYVVKNPDGWFGWSYSVSADDCEEAAPRAPEQSSELVRRIRERLSAPGVDPQALADFDELARRVAAEAEDVPPVPLEAPRPKRSAVTEVNPRAKPSLSRRRTAMKRVLGIICLCLMVRVAPSAAVIVHHCDYNPEILAPAAHEHEDDNGSDCSNSTSTDVNNGSNLEGHCDHSTAFYWTDFDCFDTGGYFTADRCEMSGKIDCSGGDKSYNMQCNGENSFAHASRTEANCGGQKVCTCSSPTSSYCYPE
jgi:hypothetical protein